MLHVEPLSEDAFCDAVGLQDRGTLGPCVWKAPSWKRHPPAVASKLGLLRTKYHGSPDSFTPRMPLSRY